MTASSSTPRCTAYTWCQWADGHTLEEHTGAARAVAASADPEDYNYDIAFGAVHIPIVALLLTAPIDGHHREPRVTLMARVPGPQSNEVEVALTLREAQILAKQLAELLGEARDTGKAA